MLESTATITKHWVNKNETKTGVQECQKQMGDHENGMDSSRGGLSKGIFPFSGKDTLETGGAKKKSEEGMHEVAETCQGIEKHFKFRMAPNGKGKVEAGEAGSVGYGLSPMALCFDEQMGWVVEPLGPKSGHWKRLARAVRGDNPKKESGPMLKKKENPTPIQELEPNNQN